MKYLKFLIFLLVGLIPTSVNGQDITTISDEPTLNNYSQALIEDSPSTRRAGRIWSDKTVYSNDSKTVTVDNHKINFDDDFLEVYSALGSNYELGETKNSPIDLVLTLDCSKSMGQEIPDSEFDETLGRKPLRIDETAKSINHIIDYLMTQNKDNQIAIVVYQDQAKTVLPLGRYSPNGTDPFVNVTLNDLAELNYSIKFSAVNEADSQPVSVEISTDKSETDKWLGFHSNFQAGMYQGLKILADNKAAKTSGNRAKFINLSDGAPNTMCNDNWYNITSPGDITTYANPNASKSNLNRVQREIEGLILQSLLTTSFLKTAISLNYNYPLQIVVIQIDSEDTASIPTEVDYPQIIWDGILNKDDYLNNEEKANNQILKDVYSYYQKWLKKEEVILDDFSNKYFDGYTIAQFPDENDYTITRPEMVSNISSVDLFETIPSDEQSQVFQDLVQSFNLEEFHPIETEGTSEYNSVLTYEEPIGRYMQVNPRKMILFDKEYNLKKSSEEKTDTGLTEIYRPEVSNSEIVKNESYSEPVELDLNQIEFRIDSQGDFQKVKITIPEECLPILSTIVQYNQNYDDTANRDINSIEDNRNNSKQSEPIRFIYGVNIVDSIINEDGTVNVNKIDPEYLKEHLNDENLEFFTTEYLKTPSQYDEQSTSGEAFTTFVPSIANDYYNAQEEIPVYVDNELNKELTVMDNISDSQEYYLPHHYYGYENSEPKLLDSVNTVTGDLVENALAQSQVTRSDSIVTIKPGLNCIGDLHNYSLNKDKNITNTASLVYYPFIDSQENPENLVRTYLGNNGKMALPVRFDIKFSITKYQAIGENSLTKDRLTVCASDIITYELRINNLNNYNLEEVLISDSLPEGLELIPNSMIPGGIFSNNTVSWLLDFKPLEEKRVTFKVKVPNVDQAVYKNFFTIEYEDNKKTVTMDSNIVEATVESPDLTLTKYQALNNLSKTQSNLKVNSGDYLTYFFEVFNQGKGRASNVIVSDPIPAELEVNPESISDNGKFINNKIEWTLEKLDPGEMKNLSFSVHIPENSVNTHWANTATVAHDLNPIPENSNTVEVDKNIPNLSIEKLQSVNNQNPTTNLFEVSPSDLVTYYLNITNNSAIIINNVTVSDNIANDLTLVDNSISNNGTFMNNQIVWTIPYIEPGNTVQVSFQVQVPQNKQNKSWNNIATLTADELDNPIESNIVTIKEENDPISTVSANTNNNSDSASNSNANSSSTANSVSSSSNNPKTGVNSNYNALIWLIGLLAILLLTGQAYWTYKE